MKKKVLVVDDETAFLRILKLNLEGTGNYEVLTLPGAEDILAQVSAFKPDIILLDIIMSGTK
ncbi:MAG: response regulator, partial [Candidatus Omnitrophica bacterium]|nr:response regulator [Candidatus Omnitrophota bacterium]